MKKIVLIIFTFTMIFSFSLANYQDECGDTLVKMNLLTGYPDGTLKLENNITRAEFSVLIMKMLGYNNDNIVLTTPKEFRDLTEKHWAYKSVLMANQLGFLTGYEDNTFKPSNNLTYAECCSIIVKVLGYKDELKGKWPDNVLNMAIKLGISKKIPKKVSKDLVSRGEVAIMLVNSLSVNIR
jgi:hypothetical protein